MNEIKTLIHDKQKLNAIAAASFGNILEWYDFGLFMAFSSLFSKIFFPANNPKANMLMTLGVFAAGFICRPLGAILFGHFGDRIGRIATLRASVVAIAIPTLLMGFLPSYDKVGILAPLLLVILRIAQGVCLGGEFTGIIVYLAEMAPANHRGFLTSFAGTAANVGILLATFIAALCNRFLTPEQLLHYGWRFAFLLGAIISLVIIYLRFGVMETNVFQEIKKQHKIVRLPVLQLFKQAPLQFLKILCLPALGAALYYICFIYIASYLSQRIHLPMTTALSVQNIFVLMMLVTVPLLGMVCDRLGRKNSLLIISFATTLLVVPCFYLLASGLIINIIIAMLVLTFISSFEQGTTPITVVENISGHLRYTGVSLAYNIGVAIFGGCAPFIADLLLDKTHNLIVPSYYLLFAALVTLSVVLFRFRETRWKKLDE